MIKDVMSKALFITVAFLVVALFYNAIVPALGDTQGEVIREIKKTENY